MVSGTFSRRVADVRLLDRSSCLDCGKDMNSEKILIDQKCNPYGVR